MTERPLVRHWHPAPRLNGNPFTACGLYLDGANPELLSSQNSVPTCSRCRMYLARDVEPSDGHWVKPTYAIDIYGNGHLIQCAVPIELDTTYDIVIGK